MGKTVTISNADTEPAERARRLAWVFFAGTFVALILNGIWSLFVGTASMGGDESDLVQGWEGVLRNSPAYLLLIAVASSSVFFAVRATTLRAQASNAVFVASALALLLALGSVTRDAAEVVMTTRAATMAWLLFGCDVVVVALVVLAGRRRIARG